MIDLNLYPKYNELKDLGQSRENVKTILSESNG